MSVVGSEGVKRQDLQMDASKPAERDGWERGGKG